MVEPTQILLFAVVIVLTSLVVIIGWQIYQILGEVRKMFSKFNIMTDNAVEVSTSISKSIQNVKGFSAGLRSFFGIFKGAKKKEDKDE